MEALKASIHTITPGYYYMVNLRSTDYKYGAAMPYNTEEDEYVLWKHKSNSILGKVNGDLIPYVWHFTQEGDAWHIQSVLTGKYIGGDDSDGGLLPATDAPVAYNINPCTDIVNWDGQPYIGYFNVQPSDNAAWACCAEWDRGLTNGYPASGTSCLSSAWTFVKANEADFLTALEEYKQNKLEQDIAHLIEEGKTTYSSGKSYFSDATPDDDLTNPGILTFNPAMPNVTSNATEPKEDSIEALFDGDVTSYFHSTWTTVPKPNGYHYLQIDLGAAYKQLVMKYTRRERSTNKAVPTLITIQSADNVSGPYKDELDIKITYTFPVAFSGEQMQNWGGLAGFEMAAPHRFIRIVVKETESMQLQEGYPFFYWSELRLYEGKGLDEENSLLAQLKDKNVEQNLLNAISKAEIALADGTANQATYDELKVAYDKFPKDIAAVQKVNANLEAYIRLKEELTSVQEELNEAKTTIENDCKDVADGFVESEQGIQDDIDATAAELDARYDAVELTKESTTNSAELKAAIQRLLSYAITSQKAYENAINRAAYARLTTEITAIQTKLDEAKVKVETDCKNVADQFTETIESIQARVIAIADSVKTQHEAINLTEESAINTADVTAAIEKLLADAAAAQRAYEIAANDAAYKRLTKELAELQDLLYAVERQVDEECKDVAADFVEAELAIQDKLNALKAELKEQHKAVELTEESTISANEIKAEIEKILADAIKAQEAYGPVTGIDGLENLADQNVKIFTVSGKQVNAVVKGQVNILVYPDGTVKRVYVK